MNAYLDPKLARENLIASRLLNAARRAKRETEARQVREFNEATAQLMRLQWPEQAARELAAIHVYGVKQ